MKFVVLAALLLSCGSVVAETYVCTPISSCYLPLGECEQAESDEALGVFELSPNVVNITAEGDMITFDVLSVEPRPDSVSYFLEYAFGHAMVTVFSNDNLTMATAANFDGGSVVAAFFKCEGPKND